MHCVAGSFVATDWPQFVTPYNHLFFVTPTPAVALNRAIAIAGDLGSDHLLPAARGTKLRRLRPAQNSSALGH